MSVIIETSKGDIVVDLYSEACPKACTNFLKLCKLKYYNNCLFHTVQRNFLVQTGDPSNTGKGGDSIWALLEDSSKRLFRDEIRPQLKHVQRGCLGMASSAADANASQFYITTGTELDSLDGRHTLFGQVAEGLDVLQAIDETPCDSGGRPLQNIRIRHTIVLDDPFEDPPGLAALVPGASPPPEFASDGRLEEDWVPQDASLDAAQAEEAGRDRDARSRAIVLEMIGDLPEAEAAPPDSVLFVCKLNPVTTEEDLEIIFSRFGTVVDCSILRDQRTGDSLCYAFVGFDSREACEAAYHKMNNVLIDDRRIKVDFSQSVAHLWRQFRKGGRMPVQGVHEGSGNEPAGARHPATGTGRRERGRGEEYALVFDAEHRPGSDPAEPRREREAENDGGHSRRAADREGRHRADRGSRRRSRSPRSEYRGRRDRHSEFQRLDSERTSTEDPRRPRRSPRRGERREGRDRSRERRERSRERRERSRERRERSRERRDWSRERKDRSRERRHERERPREAREPRSSRDGHREEDDWRRHPRRDSPRQGERGSSRRQRSRS